MADNFSKEVFSSPVGTPVASSVGGGTTILTPSGQLVPNVPGVSPNRFGGSGLSSNERKFVGGNISLSPLQNVKNQINELKAKAQEVPNSLITKLQFLVPPEQRAEFINKNRESIRDLQTQQVIQNSRLQQLVDEQKALQSERNSIQRDVDEFNRELAIKAGIGYNEGDLAQAESLKQRINSYEARAEFANSRAIALESNQQSINNRLERIQEVVKSNPEPVDLQTYFLKRNFESNQPKFSEETRKLLLEGELKKSGVLLNRTDPFEEGRKLSKTPGALAPSRPLLFGVGFIGGVGRSASEQFVSSLTFKATEKGEFVQDPERQRKLKFKMPAFSYEAEFGFPNKKQKIAFSQGKQTLYPQDLSRGLGDVGELALFEAPFIIGGTILRATSKTKIINESPVFTEFQKDKLTGLTTIESFQTTTIEKSNLLGTKRKELITKISEVSSPSPFDKEFGEKSLSIIETRVKDVPKQPTVPFQFKSSGFEKSIFEKASEFTPKEVFQPLITSKVSKIEISKVLLKESPNPFQAGQSIKTEFESLPKSKELISFSEVVPVTQKSKDVGLFGGFKSSVSFSEESSFGKVRTKEFNELLGDFGEFKESKFSEFGLTGTTEVKVNPFSSKVASFSPPAGERVSGKIGSLEGGDIEGKLTTGFFKGEIFDKQRKGIQSGGKTGKNILEKGFSDSQLESRAAGNFDDFLNLGGGTQVKQSRVLSFSRKRPVVLEFEDEFLAPKSFLPKSIPVFFDRVKSFESSNQNIRINSINVSGILERNETKIVSPTRDLIKDLTGTKSRPLILPRVNDRVDSRELTRDLSIPKIDFKIETGTKVSTLTKTISKLNNFVPFKTPGKLIPKIPLEFKSIKSPLKKKSFEGFDVFVKGTPFKKNQFFKLNTKPLSLGKALSIGSFLTEKKSIKQSFQIRKSNKKAEVFSNQLPDLSKFYSRKTKTGVTFIERRKFAINTPFEKFELKKSKRRKK